MSARISINLASPIPPYEQIRLQVVQLAAAGVLRPGDRLPTIRMLAADLGVAPGTVGRAYRELEAEGVVAAMRRRGTVVTAVPADTKPRTADLEAAIAAAAQLGRALEVPDETLLAMFRRALGPQGTRPLTPSPEAP